MEKTSFAHLADALFVVVTHVFSVFDPFTDYFGA